MTIRLTLLPFTQFMARLAGRSVGALLPIFAILLLSTAPAFADTSGLALDTMLAKFIGNISGPIEWLTLAAAYTFGVYLIVKGLFKCIKYSDEGSKGQQKFSGIWGTLMVGAMLIALPNIFTTTGVSLFGDSSGYTGFNPIQYADPSGNLDPTAQQHVNNVIITVLVLLQIIGLISFTRGLSILRSVTDGNTQVTSVAGLTHVIAGAIAWNFSGFVNAISTTVCGSGSIINGCSS